MSQNVITLNVGGVRHVTTLSTLTRVPDSMLGAMFSNAWNNSNNNNNNNNNNSAHSNGGQHHCRSCQHQSGNLGDDIQNGACNLSINEGNAGNNNNNGIESENNEGVQSAEPNSSHRMSDNGTAAESFIDADGEMFKYVLCYLRHGASNFLLPSKLDVLRQLRGEAVYFLLPELIHAVDQAIRAVDPSWAYNEGLLRQQTSNCTCCNTTTGSQRSSINQRTSADMGLPSYEMVTETWVNHDSNTGNNYNNNNSDNNNNSNMVFQNTWLPRVGDRVRWRPTAIDAYAESVAWGCSVDGNIICGLLTKRKLLPHEHAGEVGFNKATATIMTVKCVNKPFCDAVAINPSYVEVSVPAMKQHLACTIMQIINIERGGLCVKIQPILSSDVRSGNVEKGYHVPISALIPM